jgi:hypothetical protein
MEGLKCCNIVYGVTSSFDDSILDHRELEIEQGKNLVDSCIANNVELLLWSTLPDTRQLSHNEFTDIKHTYQKDQVKQYILKLKSEGKLGKTKVIFILCASYMQNYTQRFIKPKTEKSNELTFKLPTSEGVKLDLFDVSQLGNAIVSLLKSNYDNYLFQDICLLAERVTGKQYAQTYSEVFETDCKFESLSDSEFIKMAGGDSRAKELCTMFHYYEKYGLLGEPIHYDTSIIHKLLPNGELHNLKQYLQSLKASNHDAEKP